MSFYDPEKQAGKAHIYISHPTFFSSVPPNNPLSLVLPYLITIITLFAITKLVYTIYLDYIQFLSLGRGGVPYNFWGYLFITAHKPFTLTSNFQAPPTPANLGPGVFSGKSKLPYRRGPRPEVIGIIPHRQITQLAPAEMYTQTYKELEHLASALSGKINGRELKTGVSCLETHSNGLFWTSITGEDKRGQDRSDGIIITASAETTLLTQAKCNRALDSEVCHIHPIDGSMHIRLHPADAAEVLEKGWGERHPLANGFQWWGWKGKFLETGFVMVYAPRTGTEDGELSVWRRIVQAGVNWNRRSL